MVTCDRSLWISPLANMAHCASGISLLTSQFIKLTFVDNIIVKLKMLKDDLPHFAKEALICLLEESGEVIYSSHETLKRGDIYLLGFNPGGAGFISIGAHVDQMLSRTENSYIDECWKNGNAHWGQGQAPLQKRVVWLLKKLGTDPREVCASNLIFQTSRSADDISFDLADVCWPVHDAVIGIVQPRLIIAFGNGSTNSTYAFLKNKFFQGKKDDIYSSGHGNWRCKGFYAEINGSLAYVAGLPHLSRYDPQRMGEQINWLIDKL